jgi:hypothetical protein
MWLLPSRRRPANLARFFAACKATGTTTPGMVLIDRGDLAESDYSDVELPPGWFIRATDGVTQGDKIREVWDEIKDCAWLGLIGDDNIPETPQWDRILIEQLASAGIISCNDGWLAPKRVANCWIMAGPVIRAVGYIFPPGMHHLFVDDVWEMLGRNTGAWECRMDVMVRHAHIMKGEAATDETHRAAYGEGFSAAHPGPDRAAGLWAGDETVYRAWRMKDFARAADAIRELGSEIPMVARLARAKSRSVFIATPIARHPVRQYTVAAIKTTVLLMKMGIGLEFEWVVGSSNLPRVRNELVAKFLASDCTDLLFIDDDMGWEPNDVMRLLASDQPVIGIVGAKKVELPDDDIRKYCCRWLGQEITQDAMGAIEVLSIGTGFLKIERRVFEALIAAHPEWKLPGDPKMSDAERANYYRFFKFPHDDPDELGEDYDFCKSWRSLGGRIWVDPTTNLIHVGEKEYTSQIDLLFGPPK